MKPVSPCLLILLIAAGAVLPGQTPAAPPLDANALSGLRARSIGPAVMSGRIAALDATVEKGRVTIYAGAASGGLWRSANGGTTWKPVFDKYAQSIGAIRIDPANPKTVWVGTGEPWTRNSVSVGDGLYRTVDAGDTWTRMGLPDSERIAAIEVDPKDSRTVFVAALGHLWGPGGDRGLFRTTDGGQTWKTVLQVDANTGCSGLAMNPANPKVLFAAMWDYRRTGWSFRSGGTGSGLYRSEDGGDTWHKLTGDPATGLPGGNLGRIAVSVAPSNPGIVYAAVEAADGGLYRSEDGGLTWTRRFQGAKVLGRPFYFGYMVVDPRNPDRIYKMNTFMSVSEDGGRTFQEIGYSTHADHHALWINPSNTEQLSLGTDGGFFSSEDRGFSWRFHKNLPFSQYYHVALDSQRPYRVFGGLQDNSSWMGYSSGKLGNKHWTNLGGGDGFWVQPDPTDPDYAYYESQGGDITRVNVKTLASRAIKPQENAGESKFRFNWDTPIVLSPNQPGTVYMGAQYLFRTRDKGNSWDRISPDLTTNDPEKQKQEESGGIVVDNSSAENHCTIVTICESPRNGKVIWAGTDDGNLQLTRNGGKTWTNLVANVPGLPPHTWVSWVEASSHAEGTAFAAFDGHTLGDMATHVYRTDDFGQTWKSLGTPELVSFAHVIKQDPVRADLLYLGTEMGLFLSLDGGAHWAAFKGGNFPPVPVRDLAIQGRENDLVLATHGRGLWVIDDLTPLRALTPETLAKDVALLPSRPAQAVESGGDSWSDGDLEFTGEDKPSGAVISYWLKKRHVMGELKVEILDPSGKVLQTLAGNKARGFNRITWDRRLAPPRVAQGATPSWAAFIGPQVLEGTYAARLTRNKDVMTAPLILQPDPDSPFTNADRKARLEAGMRLYGLLEEQAWIVERIRDGRDQALARAREAKDGALRKRLEDFAAAAEKARGLFVPIKEVDGITGEERIREKMSMVYYAINEYRGGPSRSQLDRIDALAKDQAREAGAFEKLAAEGLTSLNPALTAAGQTPMALLDRTAWEANTARK